jgi:lysophospholipase L1-like esterase/Mg-chelatase subunit ChlD
MTRAHGIVVRFGAVLALILETALPAGATASPSLTAEPNAGQQHTATFRPGGSDVLILLDTSGSMADADTNGVVKIGAAKSAILQQVQEIPASTRLGLMTYPSGPSKESTRCPSAKLRLPVSSSSISEMGAALGSLPKPDAGTPTSDAMLDAAEYLKSEGLTNLTIVLVSDGESNCGESPCETAKKLKAENINVTVNTVGFAISAPGQSELECVAAASGGVYVTAQDASQLTQVLKDQLGNGLALSVTAPASPVPMYEQTFGVAITVSIAAGHRASNVQLQVRDNDASSGSSVKRPIMMLGNLESGASIPTRWLIRPPTNQKLDKSTYTATVTADGLTGPAQEFQVTYRHDVPTGANLNGSLKNFKNVVVLGDSYSSGEGAGDTTRPYFQTAGQADTCHRTKNQYANWLYSPDQVRILACSGAVSRNVYREGQHGEPSQLDQLREMLKTGYRPDAIFLSITGNDIGFGDIAQACAKSALIGSVKAVVEDLGPLGTCPASEVSESAYSVVLNLIDSVPGYLLAVLKNTSWVFEEDLQTKVPPIIVLKYPQLLARDDDLPLRCEGNHAFQTVALGAAFASFSVLQDRLNEKIDDGVRLASDQGVPAYVVGTDTAIPPGHNMCSADPWFVPLTAKGAADGSTEMLHPNVAGHQAMAVKINSWASSAEDLKPASTSVEQEPAWKAATVQWWPTESQIYVPLDQPNTPPGQGRHMDLNGRTVINIDGGAPFGGVTIYVKSRPLVLGHIQLDAAGRGSLRVNLQATELPPGGHTVNVLGTSRDGKPVVATVPVSIAQPFPLILWIIGAIACILLMLGWRLLAKDQAVSFKPVASEKVK